MEAYKLKPISQIFQHLCECRRCCCCCCRAVTRNWIRKTSSFSRRHNLVGDCDVCLVSAASFSFPFLFFFCLLVFIYFFIYIFCLLILILIFFLLCVCVCVCVCARAIVWLSTWRGSLIDRSTTSGTGASTRNRMKTCVTITCYILFGVSLQEPHLLSWPHNGARAPRSSELRWMPYSIFDCIRITKIWCTLRGFWHAASEKEQFVAYTRRSAPNSLSFGCILLLLM